MANKDFVVKNGLTVASGGVTIGSTERISSAGVFTGSLASANTATTQSASDNSTKIATTAYVDTAVTGLIDSAPSNLNTLNELAAAMNDNASFFSTVLPLSGGTMTGDLTIPSKIIHAGDTDTYLRFNGADDFRIVVGNSTRAAFNTSKIHFNQEGINQDFQVEGQGTGNEGLIYADASTNRVGIGTTTPSTSLDVIGEIYAGTGTIIPYLSYSNGNSTGIIGTKSNHPLEVRINNSEKMRIDTSGRLLIGTTSTTPAFATGNGHAFHISDMSHISRDDGTALAINRGGGHGTVLNLRSGGSSVGNFGTSSTGIYVDTNFGIGTTSPAAKLHISGNSDTSDEDCMLIIDDVDGSAGSRIPAIMFRSNTSGSVTNHARLRGTDTQGLVISGSSALGDDLVVQAGSVGIGTTSPAVDLHLYSTADSRPHVLLEGVQNHDTDDAPILEFYTNDSTTGGIADSTYVGEIIFSGDEKDSNSKEIYGKVRGMALDPGSGTSNKGSVELWSQVGGTLQRVLNARQIQSSGATGAVGINEVNPAYTFDINSTGESNGLRLYQGNSSRDCNMVLQNAGTSSGDDTLLQLYAAAGAGDPKIRWAISGTETWEMGIDNSVSDRLKISNGSSLGTTDWMIIGGNSVYLGNAAGGAITSGAQNTGIGANALDANTSGSNNTGVGYEALGKLTDGYDCVGVGRAAGLDNTSGNSNTSVGVEALENNSTGHENTCIGKHSGRNLTSGSSNTFMGHSVNPSGGGTSNANGLGYNITCQDNYTTIGQGSSDIRAAHGSTSWATISDVRVKKDIETSTVGLAFINDLRPVTFNYKNLEDIPETFRGYVAPGEEGSTKAYNSPLTQHGFIAQEVKEAIDKHSDIKDGFDMWDDDDTTGQQRVAESALIPVLVKAIQELSAEIDKLKG